MRGERRRTCSRRARLGNVKERDSLDVVGGNIKMDLDIWFKELKCYKYGRLRHVISYIF